VSVPCCCIIQRDEPRARERLIQLRKAILEEAGSFSNERLATAAQPTTSNASRFAADQRNAGRIFGIRFGQAWQYPKILRLAPDRCITLVPKILADKSDAAVKSGVADIK
jgi:hypothetical protein